MVPPLDQTKQILAKDLENHTDVNTVRSFMLKRVQETDDMLPSGMVRIGRYNLVEQLDLIDGCLRIVSCRSYDLQRDVPSSLCVPGEPDR